MPATNYSPGEIVRRGQERYEREVSALVEAESRGKMLALDVDTGDYEMADDSLTAFDRLQARRAGAPIYIPRIGHPTAVRRGGGRSLAAGRRPE